jgi:hypothetical protein
MNKTRYKFFETIISNLKNINCGMKNFKPIETIKYNKTVICTHFRCGLFGILGTRFREITAPILNLMTARTKIQKRVAATAT